MKNNRNITELLLDELKDSGLPAIGAFEIVLQLLAWAKLSKKGAVPDDLNLQNKCHIDSTEDLLSIFQKLENLKSLGDSRLAFRSSIGRLSKTKSGEIHKATALALDAAQDNQLNEFHVPESLYQELYGANGNYVVPTEIVQLMLAVAGSLKSKRVYCPYDTNCELAVNAAANSKNVFVESMTQSPVPRLVSILASRDIQIRFSDPIKQPSYKQTDGNLERFDVALSFPPIGIKYDKSLAEHDPFGRFSERSSSGSILQIRHIIAQTINKAVIAVPNGVLFSPGGEHELRYDLINRGMVEAVISLPPAILPFTAVHISILVLSLSRRMQSIRFVDGANERFFERDGRNRSRLVNWQDLFGCYQDGADETIISNVPVEDVLKRDAQLEVNRYVLPPAQKEAQELLKKSEIRHLADLAEFIRPLRNIQGDGALIAFEVSTADFPEFGYLKTPEREVTLVPRKLTNKEKKTFLQPGDIIIATKGSIGKVALVPSDVPPAGDSGWLANQSCLVLRAMHMVEPKALLIYLRSELGQALLQGIVSGATIPLIQLRALRSMEVAMPALLDAKRIASTFDAQVKLEREIEALRKEQLKLNSKHWTLH